MAPAPKKTDETTYSGRFAARLRLLRERTGMTGTEFVEAVQVAGWPLKQTTYYNWEAGRSEPPLDSLPTLAKVLGQKSPRSLFPAD